MRRFRRTLPILLTVVAVAAVVAALVVLRKAAPPEPARLLPGADAFVFVNLQWARRTSAFTDLPPVPHAADYEQFIQATGIEFERDMEQAAFAIHYPAGTAAAPGMRPPQNSRFSEVFAGHFDGVRLGSYLRQHAGSVEDDHGTAVYSIPVEDRTVRIAILGPDLVAASNHDDPMVIRGIIERSRKRASPFAGPSFLRANYKHVPLASLAWAIVRVEPGRGASLLDLPGGLLFSHPAVLVTSARWLGAVHLRAEAFTAGPEDARQLTDKLSAFLALFRAADVSTAGASDADVKAFFNSLQVQQHGDRTLLTATIPTRFFSKVLHDPSVITEAGTAEAPAEPAKPSRHKNRTR